MCARSDLAAVPGAAPAAVVGLFQGAAAVVGMDMSSHTGDYVARCRSLEAADWSVLVAVARLLATESPHGTS